MATGASASRYENSQSSAQSLAGIGLAIVRLTIGAEFVSVFFENLGKGLYKVNGYVPLINYYIQHSTAPAAWKSLLPVLARHAAVIAPLQGVMEIAVGILLVLGLFTRPTAFVAFGWLATLWLTELGTSWIWELLPPTIASLALVVGAAGRTWGIDAILARRRPSSFLW